MTDKKMPPQKTRKKTSGSDTKTASKKHAAKPSGQTGRKAKEDIAAPVSSSKLIGAIVRHSPLAVICTDTEGNVLIWNPAAERIFGWSGQEVLGKSNPIVPKEKTKEFSSLLEHVRSGHPYASRELERQRKDGSRITLSASSSALYDDDGAVVGLVGMFEDITARKQVEQKLAEREVMLKQIMDTASVGIALVDMTGRFTHANRSMAGMFGFSLEEFLGSEYVDHVHPAQQGIARGSMLALLSSEVPSVDLDRQYVRKDGTEFWGHLTCNRFFDARGNSLGLVGVITDITARRRAEEKLRESEIRLNTILDNVGAAIFIKDTQYRYTYVNHRVSEIFGTAPEEILGKGDEAFFSAESVEEIMRSDRPVVEREKTVSREETALTSSDGIPRTYWTVKLPLRDSTGMVTGLCGISTDITEYRQAEEAKERLLNAVSASTEGIAITDNEDRFIFVNDAHARIFGCPQDELIGKSWRDTVPPELVPSIEKALPVTLHNRAVGIWSGECPAVSKDGAIIPTEITATSRWDEKGNYLGHICIVRDITERKQAEDNIRESEERFRLAMKGANDGLWDWDLVTNEVYYSPRWKSMLGYADDELEYTLDTWKSLVHQDDRERTLDVVRSLLDGRCDKFEVEFRMQHKDGSFRHILSRAFLTDATEGHHRRLVGTHVDITERMQDEEFIRGILDTVDEGFIVIDRGFRILTANKAYCSQVDEPCDKVIGSHCYEMSHHSSRPCYEEGEECAVRHVFETGEPHAVLHRHTDSRGGILYVETKAFPIKDSSGAVTSAIETVNNITEKHLLEEERLKTQKLESIGTLAGGIAHDFNNLLQGIFGYISIAKMTLDQREKSLDMIEQAEKALQMSVNLTTQLLTFSKGGKPVKKRLNILPVIENAAKFALSGSRLDYRLDADSQLCLVEADEGQLGQVIQNIVLNADQAMPLGGCIEISARSVHTRDQGVPRVLKPGDFVEISIKDKGIGIPETLLSRIFDPYFTTKERGSGLGLATSYSIIKNHGGLIDVRSEVGKGSTFKIYLPSAGVGEIDVHSSPMAPPARSGKVLVMDDEDIVRLVTGELIRSLGHEVEFAEHGTSAVEKFQQARESGKPYDIVILDLTIRGGMGGEETVKKLLAIDPAVKAVVSSGYSDDAIVSNCSEHGFSAFLQKPYDVNGLQYVLNSLLSPEHA